MNRFWSIILPALLTLSTPIFAQTKQYSGPELMAAVKAAKPSGGMYLRLRMEDQKSGVLQVQVKRRDVPGGSDSLFQVQFPKDKKGDGLLMRVRKGEVSGFSYTSAGGVQPIGNSTGNVFNTALSIDDAVAGFIDWPQQKVVGQESIGNVPCTVVESSGGSSRSGITRVKSWIDATRYATMRVELFGSGDKPVKTVETHKVMRGKSGYYAPISFTVTDHRNGASTKVEGVRSESGIDFSDADFSEAALKTVTTASGKVE